ncbi:MAG TPA: FkbM family methyltransferase [Thermoanaerobaculia bacterium]
MTRNALRSVVAATIARLPDARGRGRLTLLLDRLLTDATDPRSYETTGELNGGFRFAFDLRPWGQKFAYYYRSWEADYVRALRGLYRGGRFVDVGSSLGLYVVSLSDLVRAAGGRIASIEPIPFNKHRQEVNVRLNGIEDLVDYADVALGAEPGRVFLAVDPAHADNNAFISTEGDVEVPVVTLDQLCRDRGWSGIGAIKMDVEGYEPKVIEGGRETIERERPPILAEFNRERMAINGFTIDDSWSFLHRVGYRAFRLDRGKLVPLDDPGQHQNLFFVPKERT